MCSTNINSNFYFGFIRQLLGNIICRIGKEFPVIFNYRYWRRGCSLQSVRNFGQNVLHSLPGLLFHNVKNKRVKQLKALIPSYW